MTRRHRTTDTDEPLRTRILDAYAQTGSIRGAARRVKTRRKTVRAALRGEPLHGPPGGRPPRPSKLDPYRPVIQRLVLEDKLTAILVLEEIRALGYQGGYSILKDYVRLVRPTPRAKVTTVLEHPPGAEGQVDWSPYTVQLGGEQRVVHAFSLVLPFSRFMVVRFAMDEQLDTLLRLHDEAFSVVGAIPRLMTYDNMTTVGRKLPSGELVLTARFEAYRQSCGFDVALIDPGRPNQHGSVERPFHYLEHNCLRRRRLRFDDLGDLNRHAAWWCDTVANVRVHGSTRERPVDRLARERPLMLPLPSLRPEPCQSLGRKVGKDFCVAVDTNRYSVPPRHVDQPATVKLYAERLEVLVGGTVVAVHAVCPSRHQRLVLPEHEEAFKRVTPSRRLLEQAFLRLGPSAGTYYDGLRQQRGRGAGYHLQRILRLADRHGADVVSGAMAHAARYGNYSADAVARVIVGREIADRTGGDTRPVPTPPERVRRWLEAIHVEDADLADYDRLIDGLVGPQGGGDDDAEK
jgi:transposase